MSALAPILADLLARREPVVLVRVTQVLGSTPRDADAAMLVGPDAIWGTIGGGQLELRGMAAARRLLESDGASAELDLPLGPGLGQCCGGRVALRLQRADEAVLVDLAADEEAVRADCPILYLFGAGHVGRALVTALKPLPVRVVWIDGRRDGFPADVPANAKTRRSRAPADEISTAPAGAAVLVATHSHPLDYAITSAALRRPDLVYVGLIGSATKRRRFERGFVAEGGSPAALARLTCPIGSRTVRDKRPAVIAALVAAELLTAFAARAVAAPSMRAVG